MESESADRTTQGNDPIVIGEGLEVTYGAIKALDGLDFHVDSGEVVAVIGPNGAGKSTLADTISGFLEYSGTLRYRGREIREQSPPKLVREGLIYCSETRNLFDHLSVRDNLELGAYRRSGDIESRLEFIYDLFPILEDRADQDAATMSGGEQQMLAVARSLMSDPEFLILDEPTLGLAPVVIEDISNGLEKIRDMGVTVLLFEQNVTFVMDHADRIYLLENGQFQREGTSETLRGDDYIKKAYLGE
ncbi:MAG: ABC transporter ATP-binding protein [Halobacteria archaeon]|nr:ABC transporter ATP-binding protein [Halobacteria archaeon]